MTSFAKRLTGAGIAAAAFVAVPAAAQTVLNFDDLSGYNVLGTYRGVNFDSNFVHYDIQQDPYNPKSGSTRIFGNYDKFPITQSSMAFYVGGSSVFDGFWLAGLGEGQVSFDLYKNGSLVGSSASVVSTSTPTFLASNYTGTVDEIRINAINGYWVGDDFTFTTLTPFGAGVPEPATWALMILGMGAIGGAMRRRRVRTSIRFA